MEYQEAVELVEGIAKEYEVEMELMDVLDEGHFSEEELRALSIKVANARRVEAGKEPIEAEEEPAVEEEAVDISGITDIGELYKIEQAQRGAREKREKKDFLARRERKLRRLRAKKVAGK